MLKVLISLLQVTPKLDLALCMIIFLLISRLHVRLPTAALGTIGVVQYSNLSFVEHRQGSSQQLAGHLGP